MKNLQKKNWKTFLSVLSVIFYTNSIFADDVKYIDKGTPAPYSGYLFTPEKTEEQRRVKLEKENLEFQKGSLEKSLDLQVRLNENSDKRLSLVLQNDDRLAQQLAKERSSSDWEKFMWFGAGILATAISVYAIKQTSK